MKRINPDRGKYYTLITGASEGIGREMAVSCARRGMNLVMVALPNEHLSNTVQHVSNRYDVNIHPYAVDLTETDACENLVRWLRDEGIRVNILINNAGIGSSGYFDRLSPDLYHVQIQLNICAVTVLTRLLIDDLKEHQPSFILNVGSLAGYFNIPYKSVYTATKSFVNTFTRSLREELTGSGVSVSVLSPGPVATNSEGLKKSLKHGWIGRKSIMKPSDVAEAAISGLLDLRPVIIPGAINRVFYFLNTILPNFLCVKLVKKEFKKEVASPDHA